jgi:ABC-type bacteriocin/lantibiotic exporter with double-glycine peptidase domain
MIKKLNLRTLRKRYRDFLRFTTFLLPYWKSKLVVIALSVLLVPLGLVMPYLTKLIIDKAYANRDMVLFIRLVIFGAVVFIITAIIQGLSGYLEEKLRLKVNFDINSKTFQHIQKFSLGFFRDKTTGEHIYKINFDLQRITHMVTDTLPKFILLFPRFLLILTVVFYLNWRLASLCLILSPILYLEPYYFLSKRRDIFQRQIESSQSIFVRLQEVFSHMHLVKAFGKESFEIREFLIRLLKRIELSLKEIKLQVYSGFTGNSLRKLVLGIVSVYGGYQIIKGQISLGSLTAIMIYLTQLIGLQNSIGNFFQQLAFDFVSCDRVLEILDRQPDITDRPNAISISLFDADVIFDNVTFGYKHNSPVIKDLSFSIKSGAMIGLVGHSGCGKTTILNLILRLYEPQKGRILLSNYDIKDIKLDSLKSQIGIALQEPFLWNDTIENNIKYGKEDASFSQIIEVAHISTVDDFVNMLPNGYKTHIGENAALISQGQKQRIAIARALIKNPAIIILDEAMSSLDSESEEKIIDNLKMKFSSSTIIVVSHRLSTVRKMDLLYFLESSNKMEIGSHEQLLERNPKYRELFASQIEPERSFEL